MTKAIDDNTTMNKEQWAKENNPYKDCATRSEGAWECGAIAGWEAKEASIAEYHNQIIFMEQQIIALREQNKKLKELLILMQQNIDDFISRLTQ